MKNRLGSILSIAGAVIFFGSGFSVLAGLLALEAVPASLMGSALMMEVVGLGLAEKGKDS